MAMPSKGHNEAFLALVNDAKSRVKEINIEQYQQMKKAGEPHLLIDVREDSEWAKDHLPGAIHLGKGVIERDIEARVQDPATPMILYCGGGYRSALAADNLQKMGYTNVVSMDGGIRDWRQQGYPLTTG